MTPSEYFDAAKTKLSLQSDYALAKAMGVPRGQIPGMRSGERAIPAALMFWLAITLELDPAFVVADLEAQREKNPRRAEFWRSFLSHARRTVAALCMLAWISSAGLGSAPAALGGGSNRRRCFC